MLHRCLTVVFALIVTGSCADRPVAPYPKSVPPPPAAAAVGPSDVFEVRVFNEPTLTGKYQVAADGTIAFPLIGRIVVEGKTPSEIEQDIEKRLADGYLQSPQVSVIVDEYRSKKIKVIGQVKAPGTFSFTENMSVVEAITRAGGFTALAKKNSVKVTRVQDGKRTAIFVAVEDIGRGKAPDFLLWPGDTVYIDERPF